MVRKRRYSRRRKYGRRYSRRSRFGMWNPISRVTGRRKMMSRCGKQCYLIPNANHPKYPVCNAKCGYSCQGLLAAYKRARQYKASGIAKKAQKLRRSKGCINGRRSRRRKKRKRRRSRRGFW